MQEYVYFVHDDRRDEPVRRRAKVQSHEAAGRLAERILSETYHHLSVEVWSEDKRILTLKAGEADAAA